MSSTSVASPCDQTCDGSDLSSFVVLEALNRAAQRGFQFVVWCDCVGRRTSSIS
jgi:hypothetical protein